MLFQFLGWKGKSFAAEEENPFKPIELRLLTLKQEYRIGEPVRIGLLAFNPDSRKQWIRGGIDDLTLANGLDVQTEGKSLPDVYWPVQTNLMGLTPLDPLTTTTLVKDFDLCSARIIHEIGAYTCVLKGWKASSFSEPMYLKDKFLSPDTGEGELIRGNAAVNDSNVLRIKIVAGTDQDMKIARDEHLTYDALQSVCSDIKHHSISRVWGSKDGGMEGCKNGRGFELAVYGGVIGETASLHVLTCLLSPDQIPQDSKNQKTVYLGPYSVGHAYLTLSGGVEKIWPDIENRMRKVVSQKLD